MFGKYYIYDIKGDDEFLIGRMPTEEGAVRMARMEWNHMNDWDKKHNKIEIRIYDNDIEDENCTDFSYNSIDWQVD